MKTRMLFAAAAILAVAGQPCLAAVDMRSNDHLDRRSAAFAGVTSRIPFGTREYAEPATRLSVGMAHTYSDSSGQRLTRIQGFQLGADKDATPRLFVGGRDVSKTKRRTGFGSAGDILLVTGGILLAGAAAFLIFGEFDNGACPADGRSC